MTKGVFTRDEIASQPEIWRKTLEGFLPQIKKLPGGPEHAAKKQFLVTGCGSTHYLSLSTAAVLRSRGISAWGYPASEIVHFPSLLPVGDAWMLAISRSGTTTETGWALDTFRKLYPNGKVVVITTQPEVEMARGADLLLACPAAQEESVAQTRSFTSMYLLAEAFAGALAGDAETLTRLQTLPNTLEKLLTRVGALPQRIGEDLSIERIFFLGGGPLYGLASECMLKTKEMTCSWAEAYHPLEFRHGPMSVVNHQTLVVGLISDSQQDAEIKVLQDMQKLGARILAITENANKPEYQGFEDVVELRSGLTEWERGALYLPVVQWIAYYRALAKKLDPDQPENLTAVVELK
jgi:glutamine---fructose-6-phosphate transaminase (isomerizing)